MEKPGDYHSGFSHSRGSILVHIEALDNTTLYENPQSRTPQKVSI